MCFPRTVKNFIISRTLVATNRSLNEKQQEAFKAKKHPREFPKNFDILESNFEVVEPTQLGQKLYGTSEWGNGDEDELPPESQYHLTETQIAFFKYELGSKNLTF